MFSEYCTVDKSLRDYQLDAKKKIFAAWDDVDEVLYQMPTGTGKTRLFVSLIRDVLLEGLRQGTNPHILIIAHRTELIEQISATLESYGLNHGVFAGSMHAKRDLRQRVQVASVQTLTHKRNRQVAEEQPFNFVIIDEAHHAKASTYLKLWDLYPDAKKLGVTATPWRMSGEGFSDTFGRFIPSMSIKQFISEGWLADYVYFSIKPNSQLQRQINAITDTDIEGDYTVDSLESIYDQDFIHAQLLENYMKFANGKRGIIYSISRLHSKHICAKYASAGLRIVDIDCSTPAQERKDLVQKFKRGDIDIIVNVDVFSEGFDCPSIEFIQLARPTKSLVKYLQQVGRGLRRNGDKECVILDNVGLYNRFGLPDRTRNWKRYFEGTEEGEFTPNLPSFNKDGEEVEKEESPAPVIDEGDEEMVLIKGKKQAVKREETKETNVEVAFLGRNCVVGIEKGSLVIVDKESGEELTLGESGEGGIDSINITKHGVKDFWVVKGRSGEKEIRLGYFSAEGGVLKFRGAGNPQTVTLFTKMEEK
ncbi:MAG: DEAD/DEAH box helicase [Bacteroidales bacterium]|nr:DEAD/DEAH box helicase [Bacteroidales bacterium]